MTTSYGTWVEAENVSAATAAATAGAERADRASPRPSAPASERSARAYERFLEMPVSVVLALMWVAGAAILCSCVLVLYVVGSVLLQAVAGSL